MRQRFGIKKTRLSIAPIASIIVISCGISACTPTVRVEVPDKPIEINLNINMKIEQNVRVRMERELEKAEQSNPGIF